MNETQAGLHVLAALHHRHETALQGAYAMIAAQGKVIEAMAEELRSLRRRDDLKGYCTGVLD